MSHIYVNTKWAVPIRLNSLVIAVLTIHSSWRKIIAVEIQSEEYFFPVWRVVFRHERQDTIFHPVKRSNGTRTDIKERATIIFGIKSIQQNYFILIFLLYFLYFIFTWLSYIVLPLNLPCWPSFFLKRNRVFNKTTGIITTIIISFHGS